MSTETPPPAHKSGHRIDGAGRLMVEGLHHKWGAEDEKFLALIDELGGWPLGYRYVGFEHTDARAAGFTNSPHNSGWWTNVADSDDYYLWKLSPQATQRFADAVLDAARVTRPKVESLYIKNSRGYKAALSRARGDAS
jgi:hypothetical protein